MQSLTPQEYIQASERTERKFPNGLHLTSLQAELLHAAMGLVTEAGEVMDQMKKHLIYGKPLDMVNIIEETGDIEWYVAMILRLKGVTYGQMWFINIAKLQKRYPDKFTELDALVRNIEAERAILEGKAS